jgi:hypothetical protein
MDYGNRIYKAERHDDEHKYTTAYIIPSFAMAIPMSDTANCRWSDANLGATV